MRKALAEKIDGKVLNVVDVPDDWTGAPAQGEPGDVDYVPAEWQPPANVDVIDAGEAAPGDTWDGAQFIKKPPVVITVLSFDGFYSRFTETEQDGVADVVNEINPATNRPKRKNLVRVVALRKDVDLEHPKTLAFMDLLVTEGVLTETRKTEILTGIIIG